MQQKANNETSSIQRLMPYIQLAARSLHPESPYKLLKDVLQDSLKNQDKSKHEDLVLQFSLILAKYLAYFRKSWETHPQARQLSKQYPWTNKESFIPILLVFQHEAGIDGKEYSYGISDFADFSSIQWLTKNKNMNLTLISSLPYDMHFDPVRATLLPNTMEGRARAYLARMELKRLLPRRYRRLVKLCRSHWTHFKKYEVFAFPLPQFNWQGSHSFYMGYLQARQNKEDYPLPDWYHQHSKLELFAFRFAFMYPAESKMLEYFMGTVLNFVSACTGQIHPKEIEALFIRQPATKNRHRAAKSLTLPLFPEQD